MKRQHLKTLVGAGLALFLLLLTYWYLSDDDGAVPQAPGPPGARGGGVAVAVEVAPVTRGPIIERRSFTGTLEPAARFELAARVSGRLLELTVDLGDLVQRGQVVGRLDDEEYRLEVVRAQAELAVAQAGLAEAESSLTARARELERIERLRGQGVASEAELDRALTDHQAQQARVAMAAAQVAQRRAALDSAELRLSYTNIRADWQGDEQPRVIAERLVDAGTLLAANAPVFTVVGLDRLVAVAHVPERDYPRLAVGREVLVAADAIEERRFVGTLARLAPVIREASRQARLEVEVPNPDQILKPGMFVRLEVELARRQDAQLVPRAALLERAGGYALYLADLEAGVVRRVPVYLGLQDREQVEIVQPELEGWVVTLGQHLLSDGGRITVPGHATPGSAREREQGGNR
ncbi:efflux RND transporter periplasmic adaptor subunit [Desulfurivibrio sp. D14AmB]|uniref:efflux RND transporter periplasmic adaptor subunit n=1 Tax=Desulfurivibrio sp. D14AmB TaxID=3374370 RepID=UPI00376F1F70